MTPKEIETYKRDGFIVLREFYDLEREIEPIRRDIHRLVSMVIEDHGLPFRSTFRTADEFDEGVAYLLTCRRDLVSVVYDTIKRLPSYIRLACDRRHETVAERLLGTPFVGFANRGYGIRMDNPSEDDFLTQLHQDYVNQLCSPRGVVFWSPFRSIT